MYRLLIAAAILGMAACSTPEPEPVNPVREAGAGTIYRAAEGLDALIAADAQIEKLADGFQFLEGPVWVTGWEGSPFLLFSDVPGNAIYKWDPATGETSDFKKPIFEEGEDSPSSGGSNGLILDADRNLLIAEHGNRRISKLTPEGEWTTLIDKWEGKRLNSPNDMAWGPDGWLYFADPPYGLKGQDDSEAKEIDFNGVFRVNPADGTIEALSPRQSRPNGIGFTPDGKTLYVANSDGEDKSWYMYGVREDGTVGIGRKLADVTYEEGQGSPDGLKFDKAGNLFATGPGGVWIYSPDGTHLGTIRPDQVPANVAWGDDGKSLYMTARTGLYRIKLSTEGALP